MGCGCGKGRKKRRQSSRMPTGDKPPVKVRNIVIPRDMTPNERRSTIAKLNNSRNAEKKRRVSDIINDKVTKDKG